MKTNNGEFSRINNYSERWKSIHEMIGHGIAICYKDESVSILKKFHCLIVIEALPISK